MFIPGGYKTIANVAYDDRVAQLQAGLFNGDVIGSPKTGDQSQKWSFQHLGGTENKYRIQITTNTGKVGNASNTDPVINSTVVAGGVPSTYEVKPVVGGYTISIETVKPGDQDKKPQVLYWTLASGVLNAKVTLQNKTEDGTQIWSIS